MIAALFAQTAAAAPAPIVGVVLVLALLFAGGDSSGPDQNGGQR